MNDSEIVVSVIVLTYNHKAYLRQALDSVLMQKTDFYFEILVGDDASSDGTSEIVREYAKKYPDLIHSFIRGKNMGATANFCDLLRRSQGRYINGCEGDDYWTDPSKLQKQVQYLEAHPECSGCTHGIVIVDENGTPLKDQRLRWICDKPVYTLKDFRGLFLPGHPVTLLHRNIFRTDKAACELIEHAHLQVADRTIAMLLASCGEIHRLAGTMACYRKVLRKDAKNVTSRQFAAKTDSKLLEYRMNTQLEDYARNVLHVGADFSWFRRDLLLRAVGKALLRPSAANAACLNGIWKERKKYRSTHHSI